MKSNLDKLREFTGDTPLRSVINETCEAILKDVEALKYRDPRSGDEEVDYDDIKQLLRGKE